MADLLAADCRRSRRRVDRDRRRGSSAAAGYGVETRRGCYHDGGRRQDRGTFAARFRRRSGWARLGAGRAARTRRGTGDRLRSVRKAAEDDRAAGIGGRNGCGDDRECRVAVAADCGSGRDVGRCGGAGFGGKRRACRGSRVRRSAGGSRGGRFRRGVGDRPEACVRRVGDKRRKACGGQRRTDGRSCRPVPRQREAASMRSAAMRVRHPGPPHGSGCRSRCRREAASPGTVVRQDGRRIFP